MNYEKIIKAAISCQKTRGKINEFYAFAGKKQG